MNSNICLITGGKIIVLSTLLVCSKMQAQVKWDGGAGDGLWHSQANWTGDIVPGPGDDIVLDNSFVGGNYVVTLPAGNVAVTIRTLTIVPSAARSIEVRLPVSNTAVPGFVATGSMYGLEIHDGGIFKNSSGGSVGTPVDISDSIRIYNGGWYIHNSSRAHAANVTVLSKASGTEQGNFEFDVPGTAGYTVSVAGRVYGNLILSAAAAGGAKSYTSTGTTSLSINGQFKMNPGANYSLNFSGAFIVQGDFIHHGNVFDVSGGLHSNTISLRKNISVSGTITETGTGTPILELDGILPQDVSVGGAITESVTIKLNNPAGITLQAPISVSYKLELLKGNLRTSVANFLIMQDNSSCSGGSVSSFIEGPMRKIGDDDFNFAIGKQGVYAPVWVSGSGGSVSDEFEAEYFLGNPGATFGYAFESPPIVRISTLEYWTFNRVNGISSKKITLNVGTHSDATLLEKLLVTRWDAGGNVWKNEGNTAYSGIATGTITSVDIGLFGAFTLASTVLNQNPLPLAPIVFSARHNHSQTFLRWQIDTSLSIQGFEVMKSTDGTYFRSLKAIKAVPNQVTYEIVETLSAPGTYFYKVQLIEKNGQVRESNIQSIHHQPMAFQLQVASSSVSERINFTLTTPEKAMVHVYVLNIQGQVVRKISTRVIVPSQRLDIDISFLPAGMYYITSIANGVRSNIVRFIKSQ